MKALIISNLTRKFQVGHFSMIDPLLELGYEVHWAANLNELINKEVVENKIKLHHIDFDRNPFKLINIKAYRQLADLVDNEKFTLIHCQSPIGGVMGRIVGNKKNVPNIVYTAHGLHFYKGAPIKNIILYKTVEKIMAKKTDCFIVMNNEDFDAIKEFKLKNRKENKFKIHGMGVDINVKQISDDKKIEIKRSLPFEFNKNTKIIISMGDLIARKDYETSIRGFSEYLKLSKSKDCHYLICGTGPEKEKLVKISKELNISNYVHFLGFRNDISELLQISDVFLFSTKQEGLPRALMEAMSAELTCIVSDIRGNNDLVSDNVGGYLFNVGDYKVLGTKLNQSLSVITDDKFAKNNKLVLENYKIENVKKEMFNIYSKVII